MDAMLLTTFWEVLAWVTIAALWVLALGLFCWTFVDVFRRRDLTGWGRVGWILLIFVIPLAGPLIYIAVRPRFMDNDVVVDWAPASSWSAGASRMSPAEELTYAQGLLAQGSITQAEFEDIKLRTIP
jgi:Phospholipase_D-nuclease N-terminal